MAPFGCHLPHAGFFFSPALGTFSDPESWSGPGLLAFTEMSVGVSLYSAERRAGHLRSGGGGAELRFQASSPLPSAGAAERRHRCLPLQFRETEAPAFERDRPAAGGEPALDQAGGVSGLEGILGFVA